MLAQQVEELKQGQRAHSALGGTTGGAGKTRGPIAVPCGQAAGRQAATIAGHGFGPSGNTGVYDSAQ